MGHSIICQADPRIYCLTGKKGGAGSRQRSLAPMSPPEDPESRTTPCTHCGAPPPAPLASLAVRMPWSTPRNS